MTRSSDIPVFNKTYSSPEQAKESFRRSQLARISDVATPAALYRTGTSFISFDFIEGHSGVGLLQQTTLIKLLEPLRSIHRMPSAGLQRIDPFLRIDPRIQQFDCPSGLIDMTNRLRQRSFQAAGTVHGDFHFGQLIRQDSEKIWLVDLDDMAMGPPEVDLGNVIAHLSTHAESQRETLFDSLRVWEQKVTSAWQASGGCVQFSLLHYFTQVALVRRALKQLEQGSDKLIFCCLEHYASTNRLSSR